MDESDEWIDLASSRVVDAFNISGLTVMDSDGVGEAFMLNLRSIVDGQISSFVLYPWLAKQLAHHLVGTTLGVREMGHYDAGDDE